jgi:hypothetical protein
MKRSAWIFSITYSYKSHLLMLPSLLNLSLVLIIVRSSLALNCWRSLVTCFSLSLSLSLSLSSFFLLTTTLAHPFWFNIFHSSVSLSLSALCRPFTIIHPSIHLSLSSLFPLTTLSSIPYVKKKNKAKRSSSSSRKL